MVKGSFLDIALPLTILVLTAGGLGTANPCEGKVRCEDGRCVAPLWCCSDSNCTGTLRTTPKCCLQLQSTQSIQLNVDVSQYTTQPQHNDMGFLQTTIYTVIGCAMAFMFIITIMVIAICRVHLKRTALTRYPVLRQDQESWASILMQPRVGPYMCNFNINNGVQFMSRPGMNPPPYSETIHGPPFDRMLPPPPYTSTDNLAHVNLSVDDITYHPDCTARNAGQQEQDTVEPLLAQDSNTGNPIVVSESNNLSV